MKEKFLISLANAERALRTADHLTYVTFPLIKEQKLLLKVLTELKVFLIHLINAILQYEYYYKRVNLYKDAASNLQVFKEKCAKRYDLSESQVKKLFEIIKISETHKKSPFEFVKGPKIVIMTDNMRTETLTLDKIKSFLRESKDALEKAKKKINKLN